MKNTTRPAIRRVCRFERPRRIDQEKDQFGCVGFWSYGFIQWEDGNVEHIQNPDFNWRKAAR